MTSENALIRKVTKTTRRRHETEYIVQLNGSTVEGLFPGRNCSAVRSLLPDRYFGNNNFIIVRNFSSPFRPEIHVRYREVEAQRNNPLQEEEIGVDFTLRYALGVATEEDIKISEADDSDGWLRRIFKISEADETDWVEVEPATNKESKRWRRILNHIIGVRPQVCRVRMGVLPDLEDKVCRIPESTMQIIGIEEGDYICIESSDDIIHSVKAFAIDDETKEKKREQKEKQSEHYVDCWSEMNLKRLRKPEVDIPEVYLDEETRQDLKLTERKHNGVCQPVRVYRDSVGVLTKSAYQIAIPIALVLVARGIRANGASQALLFTAAILFLILGYLIRHRSMLGDYGFGFLFEYYDRIVNR